MTITHTASAFETSYGSSNRSRTPSVLQEHPLTGRRVEAHPHRPKVKAGVPQSVSVRVLPAGKVGYVSHLLLSDALFVVQSGGHARATREQVRNVHAWVRGHAVWATDSSDQAAAPTPSTGNSPVESSEPLPIDAAACAILDHLRGGGDWVQVVYNPFKGNAFRRRDIDPTTGEPVLGPSVLAARYVSMRGAHCWAYQPTYG